MDFMELCKDGSSEELEIYFACHPDADISAAYKYDRADVKLSFADVDLLGKYKPQKILDFKAQNFDGDCRLVTVFDSYQLKTIINKNRSSLFRSQKIGNFYPFAFWSFVARYHEPLFYEHAENLEFIAEDIAVHYLSEFDAIITTSSSFITKAVWRHAIEINSKSCTNSVFDDYWTSNPVDKKYVKPNHHASMKALYFTKGNSAIPLREIFLEKHDPSLLVAILKRLEGVARMGSVDERDHQRNMILPKDVPAIYKRDANDYYYTVGQLEKHNVTYSKVVHTS